MLLKLRNVRKLGSKSSRFMLLPHSFSIMLGFICTHPVRINYSYTSNPDHVLLKSYAHCGSGNVPYFSAIMKLRTRTASQVNAKNTISNPSRCVFNML